MLILHKTYKIRDYLKKIALILQQQDIIPVAADEKATNDHRIILTMRHDELGNNFRL